MSFAENILDRLFPQSVSPNEPFVSETLERSQNDKAGYQKWLADDTHRDLSQLYALAYFLKQRHITCSVNVHIFNSRSAHAFSISCSEHLETKSFQHYFDYLKNRARAMGYQLVRSEHELIDRTLYIETVERHHLTLALPEPDTLPGQLYSNLIIEHISIDDKPSYIKLMATHQADGQPNKTVTFREFIRRMFAF